jgi:hypothetical protein
MWRYMEVVNYDLDHVPALLPMASAFMLLKQTPKAGGGLIIGGRGYYRGGRVIWNKHSTDVECPPAPPRDCMSVHPRGEVQCHALISVRVLVLNGPPAWRATS